MKRAGWLRLLAIVFVVLALSIFYPSRIKNEGLRYIGLGSVVEQRGADFVFEACDILDDKYFNADSINYPKILNSALNGLSEELSRYKINFVPAKIGPGSSKEEAQKLFASEFERAEKLALPVKDSIGNNLEFAAVDSLLEAMDDSHCFFIYPDDLENNKKVESGKPIFSGIGVVIGVINDTIFYLNDVLPGGPAYNSGLKKLDLIVKVDSMYVAGKTLKEVVPYIKGEKGTDVLLTVKRKSEILKVSIKRNDVVWPFWSIDTLKDGDKSFIYFHLRTFDFEPIMLESLKAELIEAQKRASGIIIDIRNNQGGRMLTLEGLMKFFLEKGTAEFYRICRITKDTIWHKTDKEPIINIPAVVIINNGCASAAEIFPAVMQDNHKAVIVGQKTPGSVNIANDFELSFGSAMSVSVCRFFTAKGKKLEKNGVCPDVDVELTPRGVLNGEDTQLKKALEVLEKIRDN